MLTQCELVGCTNHKDLRFDESKLCRECLVNSIRRLTWVAAGKTNENEIILEYLTRVDRISPDGLQIHRAYDFLIRYQDSLIAKENELFAIRGYDPEQYS